MNRVTENVYATLRRRIMAGYYAPGVQLKEEHIAAELGISRTPVRTALHRLAGDGLVDMAARRGAFVAEWTKWDVAEIFALRCLLEPYAARLAAHNASAEDISEMHRLTDRMEALNRRGSQAAIAGIQKANHEFHMLLLRAAGSPRLMKICGDMIGLPMLVGSFYFRSREEIVRSVHQHRDIILAIEARDPLFAEQAMSVHLRASHRIFTLHRQKWAATAIPSDKVAEILNQEARPRPRNGPVDGVMPHRRFDASAPASALDASVSPIDNGAPSEAKGGRRRRSQES